MYTHRVQQNDQNYTGTNTPQPQLGLGHKYSANACTNKHIHPRTHKHTHAHSTSKVAMDYTRAHTQTHARAHTLMQVLSYLYPWAAPDSYANTLTYTRPDCASSYRSSLTLYLALTLHPHNAHTRAHTHARAHTLMQVLSYLYLILPLSAYPYLAFTRPPVPP